MRILLFYPEHLPPKHYGGTHRVVLWLAEGLRDLGHSVAVAALKGSRLPQGVELLGLETYEKDPRILDSERIRGFDLVHFMAPVDPALEQRLFETWGVRSVTTVHGNGRPGERFSQNTVFLSADHARRHHASEFVYNGVHPDEVLFNPERRTLKDPLLFFSRTHLRTKNLRGAVSIARAAGQELWVAGGSRPFGLRFRLAVETVWRQSLGLGGFRVRWLGSLGGEAKASVFSKARGLLFPILWDEPFGLVIVESLMSGTPVLGSPRGSVLELIDPSVGRCVETQEEWLDAIQSLDKIDPAVCREYALSRFHFHRMTEGYLQIYKKILRGESVQLNVPYVAETMETTAK